MRMSSLMRGLDPLVRLLLLAIGLAMVIPVRGAGREIAQGVADGAIFLLFFLNGVRLPRREVLAGAGNWRFLLPLAGWCFGAMGLAGWLAWQTVAQLGGWAGGQILPPALALGLVFLGVLPSTVQSATAYSSLAGGNVAISVAAAALLNLIGVVLSAPLLALLAGGAFGGLDWAGLQRLGLILILPFALGQVLQGRFGALLAGRRRLVSSLDRGVIAIAVYVAFSGAVEQGVVGLVEAAGLAILLAIVCVLLAIGFGGAWLVANAIGLARAERISFLFAGAQKSIALGAPLASVLFSAEVAGLVLLPVLLYHLLQMVISAPLAARLSRG